MAKTKTKSRKRKPRTRLGEALQQGAERLGDGREKRRDRREERRQDRKSGGGKQKGGDGKGLVGRLAEAAVDGVAELTENLLPHEVRFWGTARFPERTHPKWGGQPKVGICFSGGGTRSAAASLGQARALHALGLMKHVDTISCISGGAWFAIPYTYLPKDVDQKAFLGRDAAPKDIDRNWLEGLGRERSLFARSVADSAMAFSPWSVATLAWNAALSTVVPGGKVLKALKALRKRNTPDDESWGKVLSRTFLRRIGLHRTRQRIACGRPADRRAVLERNPHLEADDFDVVQRDRPFLVVGGCVIDWSRVSRLTNLEGTPPIYPFEFTPLSCGINREFSTPSGRIGGGHVEPLGFDTPAPLGRLRGTTARARTRRNWNRLSVQDLMATTGAAPSYYLLAAATLSKRTGKRYVKSAWKAASGSILRKSLHAVADAMPEYSHWPVRRGEQVLAKNRQFGDGGFIDRCGLVAQLKRKVKRIVVFLNTDTALTRDRIDNSIPLYFGQTRDVEYGPLGFDPSLDRWKEEHNHVLRATADKGRGTVGYRATVNGLRQRALDEGGPVYYRGKYRVRDNATHGIEGGWTVDITWFYLGVNGDWISALGRNRRLLQQDRFSQFPHYPTFFPRGTEESERGGLRDVVDLTMPQVQLLANLTSWTVKAAAKEGALDGIVPKV
jgi:hypothetical protein